MIIRKDQVVEIIIQTGTQGPPGPEGPQGEPGHKVKLDHKVKLGKQEQPVHKVQKVIQDLKDLPDQ